MKDQGALKWRTSSRSGGANCVEVADDGHSMHVRDSKNPAGAMLTFDRRAFKEFIAYVRRGNVGR
jgi:hypothetical protein